MPQHFTTHVSRAHPLLNVVTWVAVTCGRVLASYCTKSLWKHLPIHTAAIYWYLLQQLALDTVTGRNCTIHVWWRTADEQGREKAISTEQHSVFLLSSHTAALSLFPFPGSPWGMEMLTLNNFYCIGRHQNGGNQCMIWAKAQPSVSRTPWMKAKIRKQHRKKLWQLKAIQD